MSNLLKAGGDDRDGDGFGAFVTAKGAPQEDNNNNNNAAAGKGEDGGDGEDAMEALSESITKLVSNIKEEFNHIDDLMMGVVNDNEGESIAAPLLPPSSSSFISSSAHLNPAESIPLSTFNLAPSAASATENSNKALLLMDIDGDDTKSPVDKGGPAFPAAATAAKQICSPSSASSSSFQSHSYAQAAKVNNSYKLSSDDEEKEPRISRCWNPVDGITKMLSNFSIKKEKKGKNNNKKEAAAPLPEINILLLGPSGHGKSTTINAYANYLKFSTFEAAEAADPRDFVELISSSFKLTHPVTQEEFTVESGWRDPNEANVLGESRTQGPMAYRFTFADRIIRLIDTPGLGDARGLAVDRENFERTLEYLKSCCQSLHGILIMMMASQTVSSAAFTYVITELFSRLHRSAAENVFYCFTFSRNTCFRGGDGLRLLNQLLEEEFPEAAAALRLKPKVNTFFVDNLAFRYLMGKRSGFPYEETELATNAQAWAKSAEQTRAMFERITAKEPHPLQATFRLNAAQAFIAELAEPLVRLQKDIFAKMAIIKRQRGSIESSISSSTDELKKSLYMTVPDFETRPLKVPNVVCTTMGKCRQLITVNGVQKFDMKKCCIACTEKHVRANTKNCRPLMNCAAFNQYGRFSERCYGCGCSWREHIQVRYEFVPVTKQVVDPAVAQELQALVVSKRSSDDISARIIAALQDAIGELQKEMEVIQSTAASFGYLLNKHSNSSCNQFIEPHLELLIEEEKMMMKAIKGYPGETLTMLLEMKRTHALQVKEIEEAFANGRVSMELGDIDRLANDLCLLKHSGGQFQTLVAQFLKDNVKVVAAEERTGLDMSVKSTK